MNLYDYFTKLRHLRSAIVTICFVFSMLNQTVTFAETEFKVSLVSYLPIHDKIPGSKKQRTAEQLYKILITKYKPKPNDPRYIQSDLKEIAEYYSQFVNVVGLLASLKSKDWSLYYNENTWSTIAKGSALNVDSANIQFNTRSAAKLKFHNSCKENFVCIASPADALLHEILHAHSMLVNTQDFIGEGGMNRFGYPYQHEYSVIKAENALYASMSRVDGIKRPLRNEHSGLKVVAHCVTCIK